MLAGFRSFPAFFAERPLLGQAALAVAYVLTGGLGLYLAVPPGYATAVFLPAGISVAAVLIAGAETLLAVLPGRFCSISRPATRRFTRLMRCISAPRW